MKPETRNLVIHSCVSYVFVYVIHRILLEIGYVTFDYCVTHICGATHNVGWQDTAWVFINVMPWIALVIIGGVWFQHYKDNKKPCSDSKYWQENIVSIKEDSDER